MILCTEVDLGNTHGYGIILVLGQNKMGPMSGEVMQQELGRPMPNENLPEAGTATNGSE